MNDSATFAGLPYILLHSLSHLMITALSLDCGYSASAIRERIYTTADRFGILLYTASPDAEGTLGLQEKIRVALRNVDKVITDNEVAIKDTLLNFETFTASLSGSGKRITSVISVADAGISSVDSALTKTQNFLGGLASDKYGGELLPTVISLRELIESFDKKSDKVLSDARKMLGELSQSINSSKFGSGPARR